VDQSADTSRWVLGGRNQPTVGMIVPTFTANAEYNDLTLRTAYLAGASIPVTITHVTTESLSTGFSTFQLSIPQLFLASPVLPPMDDDTSVVSITGTATFDGTSEVISMALRTADTAA
jgi:hypothetical protein